MNRHRNGGLAIRYTCHTYSLCISQRLSGNPLTPTTMARNDIEYKAVIGMATVKVANNKLDGSGAIDDVVVAKENTTVNKVVIKAADKTTEGMVRLFVEDPSKGISLLQEVTIAARDYTGTVPTISHVVNFAQGFVLEKGWKLRASTENAQPFNVIAECLEWTFPASQTKIQQDAITAMEKISTANPNLDGTGALTSIVTGALNGTRLNSLAIKALGNTDNGMVRVFIQDAGGQIELEREFRVPESKQSNVVPAYGRIVPFPGGLSLPAGYSLLASTERSNLFQLVVEGYAWEYKPV